MTLISILLSKIYVSQIDRLVALATEVDNLVPTLVSLPEHAHMVEGALLKIMI